MEVTLEQLRPFKLPLKTLEIAFQRPLAPPRGYRLRRAFIRTPIHQILDPPQNWYQEQVTFTKPILYM